MPTNQDTAPGVADDRPAAWDLLRKVSLLATSPLLDIAPRLQAALSPAVRCSALLIFTEDCADRPQKKSGDESITSKASIEELERLRRSHSEQVRWRATDLIAGSEREILALRYVPSNALLVLVDPEFGDAPVGPADSGDLLDYLWDLAAARIREKVADAPPSYLRESRAVSAERTRVTTELVDRFSASLEALLATLRSGHIADAPARQKATEWAAHTLVGLRTRDDRTHGLAEEPVGTAFNRLRDDLRPLSEAGGVELQFIEPPADGRALPGEVAHAARSIMRGLAMVMMEQPKIQRIRAQWDCDGKNLLIHVRDDGLGALDHQAPILQRLQRQVQALKGTLNLSPIAGWGTDVAVALPLDAPRSSAVDVAHWKLAKREFEVLQLLASGQGNRAISMQLGISENTVKFHIRNVFRKLEVRSRAEAAALAHSRGMMDAP
ncbi:helix-turn-helix transcriptional regulator [Glutamicibacter sp. JL.03c]|uniref:helix-turn-helix transcriptional regulator n=1 Tax=Glutamicibacter sp. JL.03c TaxID=2984842 RepID=UPI0021F7C4EE|nr:helix-turn-helix transcriptional regulator [Glutamicibacter sp. JL.03c]UYQ77105.1 helix-turn-helix transcriptional regulator [Glutamicibacter sp. JL.03c]